MGGRIDLKEQSSTPNTPSTGFGSIYPKTDGKWYLLDDGGTEVEVKTSTTGGGFITGPVSSGDNAIVRWNGTAGTDVQSSSILIDDSNNITGIVNLTTTGTVTAGGVLDIADGTVSLPGISFTGDLDSGLYRIGANNIALATNGAKAFELDASGNGTLTGVLVSAAGTVSAPAHTYTGDTNTGWYNSATAQISLALGGSQIVLFTNAGMGFGVTSGLTAYLDMTASSSSRAHLRLRGTGGSPSSPSEGELWHSSSALFFRTTGAQSIILNSFSKGITIVSPGASEDETIFFTQEALTITEMRAVLIGSSTPSVTWTIRHGTDRSGAGAEVVTGGTVTTSVTTGSDVTSFNDATIVANSFIWLETTAQSGTVTELHITIIGAKD